MGIKEHQEWLLDLIIEKFSNISGIRTGIDVDTVVYSRNGMLLWMRICEALNIKAKFVPHLQTIEDYVQEFSALVQKHNSQREKFMLQLQQFVAEKTGHTYEFDETLCAEIKPQKLNEKSASKAEKDQHLREEMAFALKLDNLKNAIRNWCKFFKYDSAFYEAENISDLTDALFGKEYRFLSI